MHAHINTFIYILLYGYKSVADAIVPSSRTRIHKSPLADSNAERHEEWKQKKEEERNGEMEKRKGAPLDSLGNNRGGPSGAISRAPPSLFVGRLGRRGAIHQSRTAPD